MNMDGSLELKSKKTRQLSLLGPNLSFAKHREWLDWMSSLLVKPSLSPDAPVALDLFAGCGGMALGFEANGIRTIGYEKNPVAVETYNTNLAGHCYETHLELGMPEDQKVEIIIGGPPCQPFSQIGYQRGNRDPRDGFPIFLDAVCRMRPKIAIIENVRGLLYRNKDYLRQTMSELERFGYSVDAKLMKAVEYGVPQKRERVVIVGSKIGWEWPNPLVSSPVTAGMALGPLVKETNGESRFLTKKMDKYIENYEKKSSCVRPRDLHLDTPSRTVTCRNLGGATSDMLRIRMDDGRRRMLHLREGARLQSFPDWYEFSGNEYEKFEQIGNAVPPLMAYALAQNARKMLDDVKFGSSEKKNTNGRSNSMGEILSNDPIKVKKEQSLNIIRSIGVPVRKFTKRRQERLALALLAVARVSPQDPWTKAKSYYHDGTKPFTTREIIRFWNEHYGENIADSSYDDVRRKDLIWLVEAGIVARSAADPDADTNDGTRGYAIHEQALPLLKAYNTDSWEKELISFRSIAGELKDRLSKSREYKMVPVKLPDGKEYKLSPGPHNVLQKAIIEEFLPRFAPGSEVLYVGDTAKKILHLDQDKLKKLGFAELSRDTLPDVVAYDKEKNWIFLIEAVHSFNPINDLRHLTLYRLTEQCQAGSVFVTAFQNMDMFARFSKEISWETEVWIADNPEHLIHFDGKRFLGPYYQPEEKT